MPITRWRSAPRGSAFVVIAVLILLFFYSSTPFEAKVPAPGLPVEDLPSPLSPSIALTPPVDLKDGKFHWANVPQQFPVTSMKVVPTSKASAIPRIQHQFKKETGKERDVRIGRLNAVKGNFTHAWKGYKEHAWLRDEVMPISGGAHDPFGGWAATLVDSLDTLWIMGLHDDFNDAVEAVKKIDFSTCALTEINVFETTIRYLGGFLGAYDISGGKYPVLLQKATEMGDMLYKAFDTPNRMPITRWNFRQALDGATQVAGDSVLVSEIGSLTLEFTRLSQATGDARYYDAVQRIMDIFDEQQNRTKLPGMWPVVINAKTGDMSSYHGFTLGGMADSLYEYLPKQHLLLGGATRQYRKLYEDAMVPIRRHIFYRPMTASGEDIRIPGQVDSDGETSLSDLKTEAQGQHLGCFAGGMVAIAAKMFSDEGELALAKKLVEGCLWAYEVMPLGIMPEILHTVPCESEAECPWNETRWHEAVIQAYEGGDDVATKIKLHSLPKGVAKIDDARYILRPEAIESVFILWRITGDEGLRERAWNMFNAIIKNTLTDIAHAGLNDCTVPNPSKQDRMESFWLAETLKYFYLIFAEPDVLSLDDYVLNTEAHPLKRPT